MSISLNEYRVYCTTEAAYFKLWSTTVPTTCPNNNGHTIDSSQTTIIRSMNSSALRTQDDNRLVVAPSLMPDTFTGQFMGVTDDFAGGIRNGGPRVLVSMANGSAAEVVTVARTVDTLLALGCTIRVAGANTQDWIDVDLIAPASEVTVNGTNTGNCILYPLGFANLIVPVPGVGTHNVDITSAVNANLQGPNPIRVSKAVPVPAENTSGYITTYNGYWDWDESTGVITPNYDQLGQFNLFDAQLTLTNWISKWSVWTGDVTYKNDFFIHNKGARVLPHWRVHVTTTRDVSHAPTDPPVIYSVAFYIARRQTVTY